MFYSAFKKYLAFLLFILSIDLIQAQPGKEAWHWEFGYHTSLDFSSGAPVVGTCSIDSKDGGASVSDATTGALLFYTDGDTVRDKNNNVMPGGTGFNSYQDYQSTLIIPKPGSSTLYYIIYTYYTNTNLAIYYAVVDMSLNAGLGAVTVKNQLIDTNAENKITAIRHCNGTDYWLISHVISSNTYRAYLITSAGISSTPVTSSAGSVLSYIGGAPPIWDIKAAPNGKKLAISCFDIDTNIQVSNPRIEIYDFNSFTGIVSNPTTIACQVSDTYDLGDNFISFSPDSKKLYSDQSFFRYYLFYQYDVSSSIPSAIIASQTLVDSITTYLSYYFQAMQLGPDGKIYIYQYGDNAIAVINNPNNPASTCNLQTSAIILPAYIEGGWGTPNFIDANYITTNSLPVVSMVNMPLCPFASYTLQASAGTNYTWSTMSNTVNTVISDTGKYWVNYTDTAGCIEADTFYVSFTPPKIDSTLLPLCTFTTYTLNAAKGSNYNWSTSSNMVSAVITGAGKYWVNYTDTTGCPEVDTFYVSHINAPAISKLHDTTLCNILLPLNVNVSYTNTVSYLWDDGVTTPIRSFSQAGNYWLDYFFNPNCVSRDSFNLTVKNVLQPDSFPNIVTPNNDNINDFIDFSKYEFSSLQLEVFNRWGNKVFESTNPTCIWKPTEDDGTYYYMVQYSNNCGTYTQKQTAKSFITIIR